MSIRWIGRYDSGIKLLRLFRIVINRGRFSHQITLGARINKLFGFVNGYDEVFATAFGIRLHWRRTSGGRFAA